MLPKRNIPKTLREHEKNTIVIMSDTRTKKKNPCGHCKEECKSGTGIPCGFCESWFHSKCIDGMTPEFVETCDKMNKLFGGSAFLCVICRKLASKINKSMRDLEKKMAEMEDEMKRADLEHKTLVAKVEKMESNSDQVKDKVTDMKKEMESGMEKAKKEMKDEMESERKEREERSENLVIYGMEESNEEEAEERKEHDKKKMAELAEEVGVEVKGVVEVKYRAGKKNEDGRPRPMIVKVEDEETRAKLLSNARRLAGKEAWRRVFVSPDLTWQQREEAREEERKLRREAERKNDEAKNAGRTGGKFVVIGQRGKRRIVWREERE